MLREKIQSIDHSVRDMSQQAIIWQGDGVYYVKINSKVGARINYVYQFPLLEYIETIKNLSANPNWNKREYIKNQLKRVIKPNNWGEYISDPQTDRIIDSQIKATDQALLKL